MENCLIDGRIEGRGAGARELSHHDTYLGRGPRRHLIVEQSAGAIGPFRNSQPSPGSSLLGAAGPRCSQVSRFTAQGELVRAEASRMSAVERSGMSLSRAGAAAGERMG